MELHQLGVLTVFALLAGSYIVESVDLTISPENVECCGKQKVKIVCSDRRFAERIFSISFTVNGKDVLKITPPRNADWVDKTMAKRAYLINTNIYRGNQEATVFLTVPRGWDSGLWKCVINKYPKAETSNGVYLKVNGSNAPRLDAMLGVAVVAHMIWAVARRHS